MQKTQSGREMPVDAPDGQKSETDPQNHSSQDIGREMDVEVKAGKGDQNGKNESGCECGGDGNKSSPDGRYRSIHEYLLKIKTGITDISMVAL